MYSQEFIDAISPFLTSLLGAYAVPVLTIIGIVLTAIYVVKQIKTLCESVKHNDGYEAIKKQAEEIMKSNQELKKQYNELLQQLSKVKKDE